MFTSRVLTLLLLAFSVTAVKVDAKECSREQSDYLIIGLGTSGSVLARYLSDPVEGKYKNSVLVLEAGQNNSRDPVVTEGPVFLADNFEELAFNPKYALTKLVPDENVPVAGLFASEQFSSGRQWFGSSAHNFMVNTRGSSDRWDDLAFAVGNKQWTYKNLLPFMNLLETYNGTTNQPADRGHNGPLQVSQEVLLTTNDLFPAAVANVTGAPIMPDYNVPSGNVSTSGGQDYSGPDFLKRSYGFNFLPENILSFEGKGQHGRKLRVLGGAQVNRVIFKGKKAIGVEYYLDNNKDKLFVAYAKKKVILCAGAPFSGAILQRSGVGSKELLEEFNIPVVVNNPLVGTGLKTHYGALFAVSPPANPFPTSFVNYCDGRNFFRPAGSGDNKRRYQITWQFAPLVVTGPTVLFSPLILAALNLTPQNAIGSIGFGWYLRPRSNGTAFIVNANPNTLPDIRFNLFTDGGLDDHESDLSAVVAMYRVINASAQAGGATMIFPPPSNFEDSSNQLLKQAVGGGLAYSGITVTNHYSGTCNMGTDISNAVVSSKDLHVFGTCDLMVVDNSIYPFPETGGTSWQAYVAGIKAADILGVHIPIE